MNFNAICIDGSLQNMGLAVVEIAASPSSLEISKLLTIKLNCTKPTDNKKMRKSYDDLSRFQSHWGFIQETITKYDCKLSIGEVPSGAQDARAAFAFGGVTAMYACLPVPFVPVYPLEVKEAATGMRYADKEDMIEWAHKKYPDAEWFTSKRKNKMNILNAKGLYLQDKNEHLADAIAVGYAGLKYIDLSILAAK